MVNSISTMNIDRTCENTLNIIRTCEATLRHRFGYEHRIQFCELYHSKNYHKIASKDQIMETINFYDAHKKVLELSKDIEENNPKLLYLRLASICVKAYLASSTVNTLTSIYSVKSKMLSGRSESTHQCRPFSYIHIKQIF